MSRMRAPRLIIERILGDPIAVVVLCGVALRIVVFFFLDPFNNDGPDHLEYVRYVSETRSFPPSGWNNQAYQPPLYYWIASAFYTSMKDAKSVQVLSLFCSIATIVVYGSALRGARSIHSHRARVWCAVFLSFCPQFVMFGLYVSNDSLAILLGSMIALMVSRASLEAFDEKRLALAGLIGLGLLVKYTFIIHAVLLVIYGVIEMISKRAFGIRGVVSIVSTSAIISLFGNYKFYENYMNYKNIILCNLDFHPDWAENQKGTYRGIDSFLDCSIHKLIINPRFSDDTKRSLPLMLYGTLWYQHIGESNFRGSDRSDLKWIGSAIYLLGLVPVLMISAGVIVFFRDIGRYRYRSTGSSSISFLIAAFLGDVFLIAAAFLRYDVWSIMQARLLFPSIFGAVWLFRTTYQKIESHTRLIRCVDLILSMITILFIVYFVSEVVHLVL